MHRGALRLRGRSPRERDPKRPQRVSITNIKGHEKTLRKRDTRLYKPCVVPLRMFGEDRGSKIQRDTAGAEIPRGRPTRELFETTPQIVPTKYSRGRVLFVEADAAGSAAANIDGEIDKMWQDFGRIVSHLQRQVLQRDLLLQIIGFLWRAPQQFVRAEYPRRWHRFTRYNSNDIIRLCFLRARM